MVTAVIVFVLWVFSLIIVSINRYKNGYREGQIDAMNDKNNYRLIEFKDGVREYRHADELSKLTKHTVIK